MKIRRIEKITDHSHLNLHAVDYQDRNGTAKKWIYASRGNRCRPDAVVLVPFHKSEEKLVLIKEFRVPLGELQYGFPAGLVDRGENVVQAGKRELFEETGLDTVRVLCQSPPIFSSSGLTDESISLLYVECDGIPATDHNQASEQIEVIMVSPEDAVELLSRPDILFDVKTWIVLERFAATGKVI